MTDNYEIEFDIEAKCEKEIKKDGIDIGKYIDKIMKYAVMFYETGVESHISKIIPSIQAQLYFDTTLYTVKLGLKERALITIDEDEVFDRLIITLWAFTKNHNYEKIFRGLGESMYQKYLKQGGISNE